MSNEIMAAGLISVSISASKKWYRSGHYSLDQQFFIQARPWAWTVQQVCLFSQRTQFIF